MMLDLLCTTRTTPFQTEMDQQSRDEIAQIVHLGRGVVLVHWMLKGSIHCTVALMGDRIVRTVINTVLIGQVMDTAHIIMSLG